MHAFHLSAAVRHVLESNDATERFQASSPSRKFIGCLTESCPMNGCLIVVGVPTVGPLCSSAHLAVRTPPLWTTAAIVYEGSSDQERSASEPDAEGDAQDAVEVCSRRAPPRPTFPVTGLKIDRPVRWYGPACADAWSICSLFLASSASACAQCKSRLRGRLPLSDLSHWLGVHVRTFLVFVFGICTARCVRPSVAQPLLCAYLLP